MAGFFIIIAVKFFIIQHTAIRAYTYIYSLLQHIMNIIIINGPNLNLLGKREPEIYGGRTFKDYFAELQQKFPGITLSYYQSNIEGELITKIQDTGFSHDGIILNAGAYTHTSIGIADAVKAVSTPIVEVHISNTFSRESFRHRSYLSPVAAGVIIGFGLKSYELALHSFIYQS